MNKKDYKSLKSASKVSIVKEKLETQKELKDSDGNVVQGKQERDGDVSETTCNYITYIHHCSYRYRFLSKYKYRVLNSFKQCTCYSECTDPPQLKF